MSLFQARDWWSTWCGGADEEFDQGCLCVGNIDNSPNGLDKIAVSSLNGVLRIYTPQADGFKPEHLMLEMQMNAPILQLSIGKFVPASDNIHLAVLHPRMLSVYSVSSVTGSVEHGNHYTISLVYEHKLERSSSSMTHGPFGNVNDKDFMCVMSMDGVLTFYEQETFSFKSFLPDFLLPSPIVYMASTDSFIVATSGRMIESYKYRNLAGASQNKAKKISPDWTKSLGDHVVSFHIISSIIAVLCEKCLYVVSNNGDILKMKKLEYNPSTFCVYPNSASPDVLMVLTGSFNKSLQVYKGTELAWAAQLPHVPVSIKVATLEDLKGVIVTVDEFGHLFCSYLGTDPSLFTAPNVEARQGNFAELENELRSLNAIIRDAESGRDAIQALEPAENLEIEVDVPNQLDHTSKCPEQPEDSQGFPSITLKITLRCKSIKAIEDVNLNCSVKFPLICTIPHIHVPTLGPEMTYEVACYTTGDSIPSDLEVSLVASYINDDEAPRVVQSFATLPLALICRGTPPVKQANYKLTIDTNKEPPNLGEIFPEMVHDSVIPVPVLGIEYVGGPVVSVLSSKQSNRYRIQSDQFEAMWLVLDQLLKRLKKYFDTKDEGGVPFKATYHDPVPLSDYFELVDNHFNVRLSMENYSDLLQQRAHQFRVIQKRLLTRFKDKTPSPLQHLDTLLEGTYKQILALSEENENCQLSLVHASSALSSGTNLINFLIKLNVGMDDEAFKILQSSLISVVNDGNEQGWEETVNSNISYLLRTCLAKTVKEQNNVLPTLKMDHDTQKLKKNITSMVERLNKGASLTFESHQENINDALGKRLHISDETKMKQVHDAIETVVEES